MESKKGVSKGVIFGVIFVILLVGGVIAGAFYIHYSAPEEVIQQTFDGGNIALSYADDENLFVIENAIPTSDVVGTKFDSADLFFDFTVKTDIEEANYVEYEIVLVKDDLLSTALDNNVKVYLEKEDNGTYNEVFSPDVFTSNVNDLDIGKNAMSVYKLERSTNGSDNYRLRMWLSDTAVFTPGQTQNFAVKVAIKGVAK